jgi:hypothetical protein
MLIRSVCRQWKGVVAIGIVASMFTGVESVLYAKPALDDLPDDHQIYDVPNFGTSRGSQKLAPALDKPVSWSFKLEKQRYHPGEIISGRLTLKNTSKRVAVEMSRPYHGVHVSTLSMWVSRWKQSGGVGEWSHLREAFKVNKGHYNPIDRQFQGKPIRLQPGDSYATKVPLNVWQPEFSSPTSGMAIGWYPGVGFTKPGRYRIFIRYVNLEFIMPFKYRLGAEITKLERKDGSLSVFPAKPIVFGPYEVEILPWKGNRSESFSTILEGWEEGWHQRNDTDAMPSRGEFMKLLEQPSTIMHLDSSIVASLQLSYVRERLLAIGYLPRRATAAELTALCQLLYVRWKDLRPSPLSDGYGLTLCQALNLQLRSAEAVWVAQELGTPDAIMFLQNNHLLEDGVKRQ